jgi:translation initiation factor IF-1
MKTPSFKLSGTITKILPDSRFLVQSPKIDTEVLCYLTGKLKRGYGKPSLGDNVDYEFSESNVTLGRIVKLYK